MQLHCLGTAGYHPNEQRHTSCYFLPTEGILLDAGTGIFRLGELIQTSTLDILISHAHLDHVAGLTYLLDVLYQKSVERIRIWGQQEKLDAIRERLFAPLIFPVNLSAQWCPIDQSGSFSLGRCEVHWRTQSHPGGSVGFRLEWQSGPSLLYLTDTTGQVDELASGFNANADLMLHECYFPNQLAEYAETTGHTYSDRVVEIACAARPKRLILTHVNPIDPDPGKMLDEVVAGLSATEIPVSLANDGMRVDFGDDDLPDRIAQPW